MWFFCQMDCTRKVRTKACQSKLGKDEPVTLRKNDVTSWRYYVTIWTQSITYPAAVSQVRMIKHLRLNTGQPPNQGGLVSRQRKPKSSNTEQSLWIRFSTILMWSYILWSCEFRETWRTSFGLFWRTWDSSWLNYRNQWIIILEESPLQAWLKYLMRNLLVSRGQLCEQVERVLR